MLIFQTWKEFCFDTSLSSLLFCCLKSRKRDTTEMNNTLLLPDTSHTCDQGYEQGDKCFLVIDQHTDSWIGIHDMNADFQKK